MKKDAGKICCEGILFETVPRILIHVYELNPFIFKNDGRVIVNDGGVSHSGMVIPLYVRNPDEVTRQINEVKTKKTSNIVSAQLAAATKRIFVSAHINPTDFKIVMLNGSTAADWNRFLEEARGKVGIPLRASNLQVMLYETTVTVQGASELEAGDKVVLRYLWDEAFTECR